ncbi:hypothetical protein DL546_003410 [Coniochaeta pulveracea]|uniref:Ubiquitin interaction domain-containing protein n=1 Tax=Coniochaeta pulveracea TaxID=177199 RepID=A0A420Y2F8_9PEZI|nr:hypothetical protein DL546_003410 [Coniochaeta pulveracea]
MGAPSRPPSRSNNRSPLSNMVNYTADGVAPPLPTAQEREDAELQQAIALSMATSGANSPQPPPQETGIAEVDPNLPNFGPANRSDYNQNEWAMVTRAKAKGDPEPARRKREPGVPAFLKTSKEGWERHRLGAIVTILHAIPMARNAFLQVGKAPQNGYGHDPDWWKGKPIVPAGVQQEVETTNGGNSRTPGPMPVWHEELHRLMAFLDATERSYGSADILANTQPEGSYSGSDPEKDFYEYMRCGEDNLKWFRPVFMSSAMVQTIREAKEEEAEQQPHVNAWGLLEIPHSKEQLMAYDNLYNVLDTIFFPEIMAGIENEEDARMAMITEPSEVLAIRFPMYDALPKKIEIPQTFYIDRYLASNKKALLTIQHGIYHLNTRIALGDQEIYRITGMTNPETGVRHDALQWIPATINKLKGKIGRIRLDAQWRMHNEECKRLGREADYSPSTDIEDDSVKIDYTADEEAWTKWYWQRIRQLEHDLTKVRRKVQKIRAGQDHLRKGLIGFSKLLTNPDSKKEELVAKHPYTLRGVASAPDTFYVCIRAESDLMEVDDAEGSSSTPREQWWKLGYVNEDDDQVKAEIKTPEQVMEEACGVGNKPFLIYASEKAMGDAPTSLSEALQNFVRFDNKFFQKELSQLPNQDNDKKRGPYATPASPSKRRNRSNSFDSVDTNAASVGSLDVNGARDDDFISMNDEPETSENTPELIDFSPHDGPPPQRVASPADPDTSNNPGDADSSHDQPQNCQATTVSLNEIVSHGLAERGERPPVPPRPVKGLSRGTSSPPPVVEHHEYSSPTNNPEMQERGGTISPFFNTNTAKVSGAGVDNMDIDDMSFPTADHHKLETRPSEPEQKG